MKLNLINKNSVRKINTTELISLHYRVHLLYGLHKKHRIDLKLIHDILAKEMIRRKIKHKSEIKNIKEQNINNKILKIESILIDPDLSKKDKLKELLIVI